MLKNRQESLLPSEFQNSEQITLMHKPSFFGRSPECPPLDKLFSKCSENNEQLKFYEKAMMQKKSNKTSKFKSYLFFLGKDAIFYESKLKNMKKMDYDGARILFKPKKNEGFFGFVLMKDEKKCEIFTKDEEIFIKWKSFLSLKLILLTFHEDFEVKKMIGKGSFAKVFLQFFFALYPKKIPKVYLSTKREENKDYAVKVFSKELLLTQKFGKVQ